jgi:peptidoglycan-N-acetylglucosamine deacetylase
MLPTPSLSDVDGLDGQPVPHAAPWPLSWPNQSPPALGDTASALPVPALSIFAIQENPRATAQSLLPPSRHAEQAVPADGESASIAKLISGNSSASRRTMHGKGHAGGARRFAAAHPARHGGRIAAHARRGTLKHVVQIKKRNV